MSGQPSRGFAAHTFQRKATTVNGTSGHANTPTGPASAPRQLNFAPRPSSVAPSLQHEVLLNGYESRLPAVAGQSQPPNSAPPRPQELSLLGSDSENDIEDLRLSSVAHEFRTAPLFTQDAISSSQGIKLPQVNVLGRIISQQIPDFPARPADPRLMVNTDSPFTAVVCGVQGSGKSHTVSILLENMLIKDDRIGNLPAPLSALVCHFDSFGGGGAVQPCEAAYVGIPGPLNAKAPPVTVFVAPSSLNTMRKVYAGLGHNVQVAPLFLSQNELDVSAMLAMMQIDVESDDIPLYMHTVLAILRKLGEGFTYAVFERELEDKKKEMLPNQKQMLGQRIALLESFLFEKVSKSLPNYMHYQRMMVNRFAPGKLTICDLTDNFISPASASAIFNIMVNLFAKSSRHGKVVVFDEAHKYLTSASGTQVLTSTVLSLTRQQRHVGMRLIISTQEPTVIPEKILGLCSFTIVHRFSSPAWMKHLSKHTSGEYDDATFDKVVTLKTGQAMVFSSSSIGLSQEQRRAKFARGYVLVKMRERLTKDGGRSILASAPEIL